MSMNFYNEIDPFAAAWLRELIKAGHITPGVVDERSIEDIKPDELKAFTQCHFFAGIGVWSHALRNAGWPDDKPVWTGSCPCQPFSTAGKRSGTDDERHLWPAFFHLIDECRPSVVFGEQVDAAIRHGWLDLVSADLEGIGYAFGAAGIPACGVGAPHIRQRIYFVADAANVRREQQRDATSAPLQGQCAERSAEHPQSEHDGELSRGLEGLRRLSGSPLGDAQQPRLEGLAGDGDDSSGWSSPTRPTSEVGSTRGIADAERNQKHEELEGPATLERGRSADESSGRGLDNAPTGGFWRDAEWIYCRDEKFRPVEPGTFPLAHGATARVGRLRGYGNTIVAPVAEAFITAFIEVANPGT